MDRILIILLLLIIIYIDIRKLYIPNILNLLLLGVAIWYRGFDYYEVEKGILGMGVYVLPLLILYGYLSDILQKEVFGFGDIKLILSMGYVLGYTTFYDVYIYYLVAFISGAVVGLILGAIRKDFKGEFPFSPFLIVGFLFLWVR